MRFRRRRDEETGQTQVIEEPAAAEPLPTSPAGARDYDPATVPWIDDGIADVDEYVRSLGDDVPAGYDLRSKLFHWRQFGFATFPQAADPVLIDAFLADVGDLFADPSGHTTTIQAEGFGTGNANEMPRDAFDINHFRVMNFHNQSVAAKRLALNPTATEFLGHVFRQDPVAMQTLTFVHGTEQLVHQDCAFVVPAIPSHLAATWLALEDISPDSGPLGYYPGSHTIRKFDWGDGMFLTPESEGTEVDFSRYIEEQCALMDVELATFLPKKGDIFMWHSALAHTGTPARDPSLTRRSLVTHFSTVQGYPRDRRDPSVEPEIERLGAGIVYKDPTRPDEEDSFARGATIQPR